jgi:hypothetical protein
MAGPADYVERVRLLGAELAAQPPTAPFWGRLLPELDRLRALVEAKLTEHSRARLEDLRGRWVRLGFLDKGTVWSLPAWPAERLADLEVRLEGLRRGLEAYETLSLRIRERAAEVTGDDLAQLKALLEEIKGQVPALTRLLAGEPDSGPSGTPPAAVTEGASGPSGPESAAVWELLKVGDFEGAYWLARALEELGSAPPVRSDLIRALVAARVMARGWPSPGGRVLAELREAIGAAADAGPKALRAAVALVAAPLDPHWTYPWLEDQAPPFDGLNPVIEALRRIM